MRKNPRKIDLEEEVERLNKLVEITQSDNEKLEVEIGAYFGTRAALVSANQQLGAEREKLAVVTTQRDEWRSRAGAVEHGNHTILTALEFILATKKAESGVV